MSDEIETTTEIFKSVSTSRTVNKSGKTYEKHTAKIKRQHSRRQQADKRKGIASTLGALLSLLCALSFPCSVPSSSPYPAANAVSFNLWRW